MHRVSKDNLIFTLDKSNEPVLSLNSGDRIVFETKDCFSDSIQKESDLITNIDFSQINPASGPVFINGALPGDVLKINIEKINLSEQGAVTLAKGFGLLGDLVEDAKTRILNLDGDRLTFLGREIPVRKMIGVIGTAPAGQGVVTGIPGEHGGNMDTTSITEGASLYLPVNVEGGLLALGDLHVAMGDGEIGVSGGEIAGEVQLSVEVLKNCSLPTPLVENDHKIITINSNEDMQAATYGASKKMLKYLTDNTGLEKHDAILLMSLAGDLKVCQAVNPKITMRMEMDKKLIEDYK